MHKDDHPNSLSPIVQLKSNCTCAQQCLCWLVARGETVCTYKMWQIPLHTARIPAIGPTLREHASGTTSDLEVAGLKAAAHIYCTPPQSSRCSAVPSTSNAYTNTQRKQPTVLEPVVYSGQLQAMFHVPKLIADSTNNQLNTCHHAAAIMTPRAVHPMALHV